MEILWDIKSIFFIGISIRMIPLLKRSSFLHPSTAHHCLPPMYQLSNLHSIPFLDKLLSVKIPKTCKCYRLSNHAVPCNCIELQRTIAALFFCKHMRKTLNGSLSESFPHVELVSFRQSLTRNKFMDNRANEIGFHLFYRTIRY